MKQAAKKALKHPLVYGSTIVVFGGLLANVFNFLFNLIMSRSLSVTDYGILASIISLITFPALLANAINPVVIQFAGNYFAKGDYASLRGLYLLFAKFILFVGGVGFIIFSLFLPQIGDFFHISNQYILLLADIIMFVTLMTIINTAFLQAKLAFTFTVLMGFVSSLVKFLFGMLALVFGYGVFGAVGALVISSIVGYAFGLFPMKFIFSKKLVTPKIDTKQLFAYGIPSALTLAGLISFISSDILFTKHFFSPEMAGLYAGLSLIGRIIFFLTVPISTVMFPIIVRKHNLKENFNNTFKLAVLFTIVPALLITAFYFLFPNFSILFILKKSAYLAIAPYIGYFALYITFYCLLYLLATFYLSIKKTNIYIPTLVGAALQIVFISIYHQTIQQIIIISSSIVLVLMIGFLLYYPYATKK